jgi:quercetin dioxygenase-like cupin family protein
MNNAKPAPITVDPTGGELLSVAGGKYRILVSGKQTNGAFATIEMSVPPKSGPGPHSHASFSESFYILEGEVEVHSEAGSYTAKKGAFVVIPEGGIVHNFKNVSDHIAVLLCIVVPAGLEAFFQEIGEPMGDTQIAPPSSKPGTAKDVTGIAEKYGQVLYPPDFFDQKKS